MKRLFDLLAASLAMLILSPIFIVVSLAIWISMGRPIFFRQGRTGRHGEPFDIIKFRTMGDATDANGRLLSDDKRITRLGRFLRGSSLDELPELLNVLRGEMSLVGPRPFTKAYRDRYNPEQFRRHLVRPGITGWAQINGRNAISWEEKFRLDLWYIDHHSFLLDLRILFATIGRVLFRQGINASADDTMPEFMGTPDASSDAAHTRKNAGL